MGRKLFDRIVAWLNRPQPCLTCGKMLASDELCTAECEDLHTANMTW